MAEDLIDPDIALEDENPSSPSINESLHAIEGNAVNVADAGSIAGNHKNDRHAITTVEAQKAAMITRFLLAREIQNMLRNLQELEQTILDYQDALAANRDLLGQLANNMTEKVTSLADHYISAYSGQPREVILEALDNPIKYGTNPVTGEKRMVYMAEDGNLYRLALGENGEIKNNPDTGLPEREYFDPNDPADALVINELMGRAYPSDGSLPEVFANFSTAGRDITNIRFHTWVGLGEGMVNLPDEPIYEDINHPDPEKVTAIHIEPIKTEDIYAVCNAAGECIASELEDAEYAYDSAQQDLQDKISMPFKGSIYDSYVLNGLPFLQDDIPQIKEDFIHENTQEAPSDASLEQSSRLSAAKDIDPVEGLTSQGAFSKASNGDSVANLSSDLEVNTNNNLEQKLEV